MPEPQSPPGTELSYSPVGYVCLTELIDRAAGRPIAEIARQHLFEPLGMTSTCFWTGPELHPPTVADHPPWLPGVPAPRTGDGIWSTARDMLRWAEAMHTGKLGPRLTATLRQPGKLRDNTMVPYAWGASILPGGETPAYAHAGSWPGCQTYVIAAPATGTAAVVIAYTNDSRPVETLGRKLAGIGQGGAARAVQAAI